MMSRTLVPLLVALAALAVADSAMARTWTVWAGEPGDPPREMPEGSEAMLFFPAVLTINAGDSVTFRTSEGHSVTSLGPRKAQDFQFIVPDPKKRVYAGLKDAAGAPFWFVGKSKFLYDLQTFIATAGSTTLGDDAFHQRVIGDPKYLPGAQKSVTFAFPKVGTYKLLCMFHYPVMKVTIVVRPVGAPIPSEAAVATSIETQFTAAVATANELERRLPPPRTVYAGIGKHGVEFNAFFPKKLTVPAGTTVTFVDMSQPLAPGVAPHNEVFGGDEQWIKEFFKRSGQFNRPGLNGQLGPELIYGTEPPGRYTYTGSNHGNGFLVTPLIDSFPSSFSPFLPPSFFSQSNRITFPKRGTYHYYCEIHGAKMDGDILVQ